MKLGDIAIPSVPIPVSAVYGVIEGVRTGQTDLLASALGAIGLGIICTVSIFVCMHKFTRKSRNYDSRNFNSKSKNQNSKKKRNWW